jgi:hypothetical protein
MQARQRVAGLRKLGELETAVNSLFSARTDSWFHCASLLVTARHVTFLLYLVTAISRMNTAISYISVAFRFDLIG